VEHLHHKSIKTFTVDGIIKDDAAIGRLRLEIERLQILQMRELGYVPRLDIDPQFTIQYNNTKEYFEFILTLYGTYLGKKKSQCIMGIDGTLLVPTHKNRLKELSMGLESTLNQK
jgi:hypothetical protein